MKKIVILGLDNFSRKELKQVIAAKINNYSVDVFVNDTLGDSWENFREVADSNTNLIYLKHPRKRIKQIYKYFKENKNVIHHIEIYGNGRFSPVYLILSKLFGLTSIAIERGDIGLMDQYPLSIKFAIKFCHRFCNMIWYREVFMERVLSAKYKRTKLFFLPNSVIMPECANNSYEKEYDFLWVNRLVHGRRADWFVNVLTSEEFTKTKNVLTGLIDNSKDTHLVPLQDYVKKHSPGNLYLYQFCNPTEFYKKARFFVLPAEKVFCNNALIEAMSYGVVPIVSAVDNADLIVEDGINGILCDHTEQGLQQAMQKALRLKPEEYERMSYNAEKKIREEFSFEQWSKKLMELYSLIA